MQPALSTNTTTNPIMGTLPPPPRPFKHSPQEEYDACSPQNDDADSDEQHETPRGRPPLSQSKSATQKEREDRLEKDRMRKTKYRREKLAQLNDLKATARSLEIQLEQLTAKKQLEGHSIKRYEPYPTVSGRRVDMWRDIAEAEIVNVRGSVKEQEELLQALEENLQIAIALKRNVKDRSDVPLCFDPRRKPDIHLGMNSLTRHPSMRDQNIHALLDAQYNQLTEELLTKFPTADNEGTCDFVLSGSSLSFVELKKFGILYGHVTDVADVMWRVRPPGSKVQDYASVSSPNERPLQIDNLDNNTTFMKVFYGPMKFHFLSKRYIEPGRVVMLCRTVLYDEVCPEQNLPRHHILSWIVVEDISHPTDKMATSCIRGYTQACLNTADSVNLQSYTHFMKDVTRHNLEVNGEFHRHFRCLILN
ncbi:unnamed protein product [Aphanomyces euteiches]